MSRAPRSGFRRRFPGGCNRWPAPPQGQGGRGRRSAIPGLDGQSVIAARQGDSRTRRRPTKFSPPDRKEETTSRSAGEKSPYGGCRFPRPAASLTRRCPLPANGPPPRSLRHLPAPPARIEGRRQRSSPYRTKSAGSSAGSLISKPIAASRVTSRFRPLFLDFAHAADTDAMERFEFLRIRSSMASLRPARNQPTLRAGIVSPDQSLSRPRGNR